MSLLKFTGFDWERINPAIDYIRIEEAVKWNMTYTLGV